MATPLVDLFLDAVRVNAPSLAERPMAEFVRRALAGSPVRIVEDGTAALINGDCGNLICIPPSFDASKPATALFAHLDTPRPTEGVHPVVSDTRIESDGTTILGVDNRAGTSVLLHTLREAGARNGGSNYIVVFTVGEELGMLGSKHVDLAPYNVDKAFIFDCSRRPGTFIAAAVGCSMYTATFRGRSSHAGVAPEKGIHAIRIAANAISRITMGRHSPTMTSNVGTIRGGSATNIVPDSCSIEGEARSFDPNAIEDHLRAVHATFRAAAEEAGGSVDFEAAVDFEPFTLDAASPVFKITESALRSIGLAPNPIEYLGGSDANTLNGKGIPAVNLGIGAQNPHGNDEFILLEDLHTSARLAAVLTGSTITP
jgi:tripeptide aminopeptidase